jgi:transcription antitermination factor NusG
MNYPELSQLSPMREGGNMNNSWFVLQVMTGRERAVVADLGEAGMEGYAPEAARWLRRGRMRRVQRCSAPIFGGYVMVAEPRLRWPAVRAVDGVYGVVGVRGVAARLDGAVVEQIRLDVAGGLYDEEHPSARRTVLRVGDRVEVVGTAFDGLAGRVVANGNARVRVDLGAFGVCIPIDNLRAAA